MEIECRKGQLISKGTGAHYLHIHILSLSVSHEALVVRSYSRSTHLSSSIAKPEPVLYRGFSRVIISQASLLSPLNHYPLFSLFKSDVEVRVARIFNTFGPRMHPNDGRVVSNFIIQALQGKDITIYGQSCVCVRLFLPPCYNDCGTRFDLIFLYRI